VLKFKETTFGVAQKHILAGVWYLRLQCRFCISAQYQWESFCSSVHGFLVGELEEMPLRSQKAVLQSWPEHCTVAVCSIAFALLHRSFC
jgi:hypothetical protein